MEMGEDTTLLRDYVEGGSDRAFTALVNRHFNLVYTTALRIANGDAHLAQDVAQSVFTDVARKAKSWPRDLFLGGWLYQHTCFMAANAVRKERRRLTRERQAFEMNSANDGSDPIWSSLGPFLDDAMRRLGSRDRDVLVLRFFGQKSYRTMGAVLGISEEAARKRVDRALEKLRGFFARRGLSFSVAVLMTALDTHAAALAPVGLASVVANGALAEAAKNVGTGLSLIKLIMTITKTKIAVAAMVAALTTTIFLQSQEHTRLERENRALRQQTKQLVQLRLENERLSQARASGAADLNQDQLRELMRLRGQVGVLKEQLGKAKKPPETRVAIHGEQASEDTIGLQRQIAMAKMNYAKQWMVAFLMYGGDHQHACPTGFDQAAEYWTVASKDEPETNLSTNQFQVLYQGAFNAITNPAQTIVVAEVEPVQGADGGWFKAYGFADGHAEFHKEADGNFIPWESQHIQTPAP
jgi:RNA polymerase sigma factor (sigma-70 family)